MSLTERPTANGFTLVEMLVALAIFGMAALALLKLVGVSVASAGAIDRALVAQLVAENVLIEAMTDPGPPPLGTLSGSDRNAGIDWRWTRRVSRLDDVRLTRIDVAVSDATGRPLATLSSVRSTGVPQ